MDIQPSSWMRQLLVSTPAAASLPVCQLFIPGTHDSGTFELSSSSHLFIEHASGGLSKTLSRLVSLPGVGKGIKGIAAKWSKTQALDAYCQLRSGIRLVVGSPV